ncbi:MAG: ATP-binding cassette domain-containing protein [Bacilli bacterium]|nr:ATP-binding cassette domain-containing protein [Bacilli bacterium]
MAKLHFRNVNKIYPNNVQAVFDFNLDVDDKEFIVFVGPSGCGKSTTLRMVAGLEEISSGEIYIDDTLINDVPPKDRNIAMVFQNYALYPHLTVYENMAFSLQQRKDLFPAYELDGKEALSTEIKEIRRKYDDKKKEGIKELKGKKAIKEEIKDYIYHCELDRDMEINKVKKAHQKRVLTYDHERYEELKKQYASSKDPSIKEEMDKVKATLDKPAFEYRRYKKEEIMEKVNSAAETIGLEPYLKRKPAALSGGQRQRVALGRAIVRNPKVFLMDEPLSNLDAKLRVQMRTEISKIHKALGVTMIYVTHDQTEAMTMATRIVCMKDGYIQQIGSPKELYNSPNNLFVAGFIGSPAMNFIKGKVVSSRFIADEGGISIELDKSHAEALKGYEGKDVVLGVRPENIMLKGDKTKTNLSSSFKMTCDLSELLGQELIIYNYIGDTKVVVKTSAIDSIEMGEAKEYCLDMDRIHFFDAESTKRIV